ncbi:hypothetical protein, partial [Xanthomonas cannabis]
QYVFEGTGVQSVYLSPTENYVAKIGEFTGSAHTAIETNGFWSKETGLALGWGLTELASAKVRAVMNMAGTNEGFGKGGKPSYNASSETSNSVVTTTNQNLPGNQTVSQFEKGLFNLPPGDRVAQVKTMASAVAADNGLVKDNNLTRITGRDVYRSKDGSLFAVDSQHGRFEVVDAKTGKHLGEVDFSLCPTKPAARDKSHDLKAK